MCMLTAGASTGEPWSQLRPQQEPSHHHPAALLIYTEMVAAPEKVGCICVSVAERAAVNNWPWNKKKKKERKKERNRKSFASISTSRILPQPAILWCVCVYVCLSVWIRMCVCEYACTVFVCACVCVFVSSLHFTSTATNHPKSKWGKCAFHGRNSMFGVLWTSQPHLETLFLEDQGS